MAKSIAVVQMESVKESLIGILQRKLQDMQKMMIKDSLSAVLELFGKATTPSLNVFDVLVIDRKFFFSKEIMAIECSNSKKTGEAPFNPSKKN